MNLLPRLLLLCLLLPAAAQAQQTAEKSATYAVATGQSWLDARLSDINHYAERYPDSFLDELERYAGARRDYAQALMQNQDWHAADVYLACFWAKVRQEDCREYVRAYSQALHAAQAQHADTAGDSGEGRRDGAGENWKAVLGSVGEPPTPAQWRALRAAVDASYTHWDRPRP